MEEWRSAKWKTLDFPRLAREDFGLNGVEFVNTMFEVPTEGYLKQLKNNADAHGVALVLIMVDEEGDGCAPTPHGRKEFQLFHRKWVDIAHYLGCHAIRTNCRGPPPAPKSTNAWRWIGRPNLPGRCWNMRDPPASTYSSKIMAVSPMTPIGWSG